MIITDDMKSVLEKSSFLSVVTVGAGHDPHLIIVGKAEVAGDTVTLGVYKMDMTRKNLMSNKKVWLAGATLDGGPKGYRLSGTAEEAGGKIIFTANNAESLL